MLRGKRIICLCLAAVVLFSAIGCRKQEAAVPDVASQNTEERGAATQETDSLSIAKPAETVKMTQQDTEPLSVENQFKTIAKYAEKWREGEYEGDSFGSMNYAVTDLDQNGRLELIASSGTQGSGKFTYTDYFQINPTGDGIKKLKNSSMADIVENISTAYFDPDTLEYHYISSDFATGGLATGYYTDVESLTLRGNAIVDETLSYKDVEIKKGKENIKYFYTYSGEKKEISASEFSSEKICNKAYANCGKLSVNVSWFSFERNLDEMTEEQTIYYLKQSYEAFRLGTPLRFKKKKVNGFRVKIPQFIAMQDKEKQKRLNRLIEDAIEEKFNEVLESDRDKKLGDTDSDNTEMKDKKSFGLRKFHCTVKYAGEDRVSILVEMSGSYPASKHSVEQCYGINIDLEKESFLSQADILPEEYRETVENLILEGAYTDIKNGEIWQKYQKKKSRPIIKAKDWEDLDLYQTPDSFGVIVPTTLATKACAVYEVPQEAFAAEESYEDVNWEEYQYRMSPEEYQALQEYMPVLTGGEAFNWVEEKIRKRQIKISEKGKVTIPQFFEKKREGKEKAEEGTRLEKLDYVSLCDLTGDGEPELLLSMDGYGIYLLLHREGDLYYGLDFDTEKLWFQGMQTNEICVRSLIGGEFYYRINFENGSFQEEMLGGYNYSGDDEKDDIYYVNGKKVKEGRFDTWYEDIESKGVGEYIPAMKRP